MIAFVPKGWPSKLLIVILALLVFGTLLPYGGNPSALFHMDKELARGNVLPGGFVLLDVPAYDGAQYYHVARNVPKMTDVSQWKFLRMEIPASYGYQRFLLPFLAFAVSLGQTEALPNAFLAINVACLFGAFELLRRRGMKPLYGFALALCPAALIGLHFSLAEPLTLVLMTAFLLLFGRTEKIGPAEAGLLSLLVLTREVNVLFAGFLTAYLLARRQWKNAAYSLVPLAVFVAFHAFLYVIFHDIPFLESGGKNAFPFQAIVALLTGAYGYDLHTFTSIALFLGFVGPAILWVGSELWTRRTFAFLPCALFAFLLLMTMMPDIIWGSITSIGRVITPVYPLFLVYAAHRDTRPARLITWAILGLGLASGIGLALIVHPFTVV